MIINIKTFLNKTLSLSVQSDYSIIRIKKIIEARENLKCERQDLFFTDVKLENEKTLQHYNIKGDDTLQLIFNGFSCRCGRQFYFMKGLEHHRVWCEC